MNKFSQSCVVLLCCVMLVGKLHAQETSPYYIRLNDKKGHVYEINDDVLNLQYHDHYGRWADVALQIRDWRNDLVATVSIDKSFGLNNYSIRLAEVGANWKEGDMYSCELRDESGAKHYVKFRLVAPPDLPAPVATILVNPVQTECTSGQGGNSVEFFGAVDGGKGPYAVTWFVLNSARTDFLYQPRQETLVSSGQTTSITVGASPGYYVVLFVRDACGKTEQKAVNLVCGGNNQSVNTIFIEDLTSPLLNNQIK